MCFNDERIQIVRGRKASGFIHSSSKASWIKTQQLHRLRHSPNMQLTGDGRHPQLVLPVERVFLCTLKQWLMAQQIDDFDSAHDAEAEKEWNRSAERH